MKAFKSGLLGNSLGAQSSSLKTSYLSLLLVSGFVSHGVLLE